MRLGVHVISFDVDGGPEAIGSTLARVGEAAERAGAHVTTGACRRPPSQHPR